MQSAALEQVLRQVQSLSAQEQSELRSRLWPPSEPANAEQDKVAASLLGKGIISRIPPRPTAAEFARFKAWKPVKAEGKPISETIVEERR